MLSSLRRSGLIALTLALAGPALALANQPAMVSAAPRPVRAIRRGTSGANPSAAVYGRKSAGISVAQGKRSARKARNVARNRANHR